MINAQYNIAAPDSFAIRIAEKQRRKMFTAFLQNGPEVQDRILDVGATSDQSYSHSNYLEAWYPQKNCITAVGLDDASFLSHLYPGITVMQADGRSLPFANASFDFVHSSAVLEHVGSRAQQIRFLAELWRVARKGLFVTTPDRWFPVEFHSMLPLAHWLPPSIFRALLRGIGQDALALEDNLNLLSGSDLRKLAAAANIPQATVRGVGLMGWRTNLILTARK